MYEDAEDVDQTLPIFTPLLEITSYTIIGTSHHAEPTQQEPR